MKKIREEVQPDQIILITGIGKCYGIVRGHTILNNLHSIITNNPLIMFYQVVMMDKVSNYSID